MWPFRKAVSEIEGALGTLDPFITATLSMLEPDALKTNIRKRQVAMYYLYGAVKYLADYDEMSSSKTTVLVANVMMGYLNADQSELDNLMVSFTDNADNGEKQLYMIEGASALRRWMVSNEKSVAEYLKFLLDKPGMLS